MSLVGSIKRGFKLTAGSFEDMLSFMEKGFKRFMLYFIVGAVIAVIGYAAIMAVMFGAGHLVRPVAGELASNILAAAICIAIYFAMLVYGVAAFFGALEYAYHEKKVGYFTRENVGVAVKYALFAAGIMILSMAVILGVGYLSRLSGAVAAIVLLIAMLLFVPVSIILVVMLYYTYPEMGVRKKGPIAAMRGSWGIAKNNFWETLVFGILTYIALSAIIGIIYVIFIVVFYGGLLAALLAQNAIVMIIVVVLSYLLMLAILVPVVGVFYAMHTKFYKRIVEKRERA